MRLLYQNNIVFQKYPQYSPKKSTRNSCMLATFFMCYYVELTYDVKSNVRGGGSGKNAFFDGIGEEKYSLF